MQNSPDVELAERITGIFKEKKLISKREYVSFENKFKLGTISPEDWKFFAESTVYDEDKSE